MMNTRARFALSFVATLLAAASASAQAASYEIPRFEPEFWNCDPEVRLNNNCYNYAMNKQTNTFAQPGKASNNGVRPLRSRSEAGTNPYEICDYVAQYALLDGAIEPMSLTNEADDAGECGGGRTKVALVVAPVFNEPDGDYHWYRRDSNGWWSHKPGDGYATNLDDCDQPISSPETACRDKYTEFCGYYCTASTSSEQGMGIMSIQ